MEGELQDQGKLGWYLEEWLFPRGSQPNCDVLSVEEKQDSTWIEGLTPEGETISNQDPEGEISAKIMIVLK